MLNDQSILETAMDEWLDAANACEMLGVKPATLYAYVSRGLVRSTAAMGPTRAKRYARADLERLRARSSARAGHTAAAAGALRWGEPVLDTAISEIRGDGPWYRGHSAVRLAERDTPFETVAELLWSGELVERQWPPAPPARSRRGTLDDAIVALVAAARRDRLRQAGARAEGGPAIVHALVGALAGRRVEGGVARSVLVGLGGRAHPAAIAAVDRGLVLSADHELNPSTFAARITAGVGADLYACAIAAVATLSGPRHGAATARIEAFRASIDRPRDAADRVRDSLARGEELAGFGHPLYPNGDPRARPLLRAAKALGRSNASVLFAITAAAEKYGALRPSIDFALVTLGAALGLGDGAALAMFAIGRSAGWVAHAIEQRHAGFSLRPRARYATPEALLPRR
jgi:citrate synthase